MLPSKICVLDIETYENDFLNKKNCKVAIAGIKTFAFKNNEYVSEPYRCFLEDELGQLKIYLDKFNGPIIGFNLYDFDLPVLNNYFSVEKIIPKVVDVLLVLYLKNRQELRGLSLDKICQLNFKKGKTNSGGIIPNLWLSLRKGEVIQYNENDCDLTYKLWLSLALKKDIFYESEIIFSIWKGAGHESDDALEEWDWDRNGTPKLEIILDGLHHKYILGQFPISYLDWKETLNGKAILQEEIFLRFSHRTGGYHREERVIGDGILKNKLGFSLFYSKLLTENISRYKIKTPKDLKIAKRKSKINIEENIKRYKKYFKKRNLTWKWFLYKLNENKEIICSIKARTAIFDEITGEYVLKPENKLENVLNKRLGNLKKTKELLKRQGGKFILGNKLR